LSLVLDGVDGALLSPVLGGGVGLGENDDVLLGGGSLVSGESLHLVLGEGGELVVSNGEGVLGVGVDLFNLGVLILEDGHSEGVLLGGSEGDSVEGEVLDEDLLDLGVDGGGVGAEVHANESSSGAEVHKKVFII